MKKLLFLSLAATMLLGSCSKDSEQIQPKTGQLVLKATGTSDVTMKGTLNVDNYSVTITKNGESTPAYTGIVSGSTNPIDLAVGTYTVSVSSPDIAMPAFNAPLYGATQSAAIEAAKKTDISLVCKQTNAGIKVTYAQAMLDYCTAKGYDIATVIAAGAASLDYGKKSTTLITDAGYFNPGTVTVKVTMNGNLYTKDVTLAAQELVTVNINVNQLPSPKLQMTITADNGTTTSSETFTFNEI